MKKNDYNSLKKAQQYYLKRFKEGLELVDRDEMKIIGQWLNSKFNPNEAVVVDLGTGTGRAIRQILGISPKTIYAFDQSPAMLKVLTGNYKDKVEDKIVRPVVGSSEKISLPKKSVDVVISLHLFKHLKDIRPTLREINKILKLKGILIFDALNVSSIIRFNLGTCYALDKATLLASLTNLGFEKMEIKSLHAFGETIYNFPGASFFNIADKLLTKTGLPGTKFFVLAQKNA